jgi:hypothetical protein
MRRPRIRSIANPRSRDRSLKAAAARPLASAASDLGRRVAERRVGECVERLLEVVQLPRDELEAVLSLRRAVESFELVRDPVESLQQRVELAISDVVLVHEPDSTDG